MHIPLNEAQQSIAKDNRAVVKLWAIKRILHRRQRQMHQAEGYATLLLHFCANRVPDDKQTRLMADAICYIVVYAISFMVYGLWFIEYSIPVGESRVPHFVYLWKQLPAR